MVFGAPKKASFERALYVSLPKRLECLPRRMFQKNVRFRRSQFLSHLHAQRYLSNAVVSLPVRYQFDLPIRFLRDPFLALVSVSLSPLLDEPRTLQTARSSARNPLFKASRDPLEIQFVYPNAINRLSKYQCHPFCLA